MSSPMHRRRSVLRSLSAVAAALVLLVSVAGYAAARRYDAKIQRVQVFSQGLGLGGVSSTVDDSQPGLDPMNVLIVGIDNREGLTRQQRNEWHLGHADYGNQTDTIMVVHIGRDGGHVTVVSLPRDSLVRIPEYTDADGTKHDAHDDKINAAFALGGPALTVKTVESVTGLKIDHYVGVSLAGFVGMVDAVDGVDVCLAAPIKDNPKYTSLDLPAGRSTLRGGMALSFVRARHVGSDFGRIQRQQQFMAGLLKKATSLGILANPVRLDQFVSAAAESLQVDETLDRDQILALANRLSGTKLDQIEFARLPIANDDATDPLTGKSGYVTWQKEGAKKIFDAIRADQPIVLKSGSSGSATPKPAASPSDPKSIRVRVLNGSGVTGLGKQAATELKGLGFALVGEAENDSGDPRVRTRITYPTLDVAGLATLAQAFPDAQMVPSGDAQDFEVSVGSSFSGVQQPAVGDAAEPNPGEVEVRVLNGSGIEGRATAVADELTKAGFMLAGEPGNAPEKTDGETVVRFDPAQPQGLATVIRAFPGATFSSEPGLGPVFEVIVGANFGHVVDPTVTIPVAKPGDQEEIPSKPVVASSTVCSGA